MFVKDWFRELNSTGPHTFAGAVINFAIASMVKCFIYKLKYLLYCQKIVSIVSRVYFWRICLSVRNVCQIIIFKQIVCCNLKYQSSARARGY